MAQAPDARLFVLFLDIWHVHIEGSYRAQNPIANFLERAIGQDDMVGVMTPEMSARNLTLARRTTTIEGMLRDNWTWGQRQRLTTPDPRELEFEECYPTLTGPRAAEIVRQMVERRRVRKTLDSIEDLIIHLEGIRDERKFVVLLSEGWLLPGPSKALTENPDPERAPTVPSVDPIGIDPNGKLTTARRPNEGNIESCDRERTFLAQMDFRQDFQNLLYRANRANISFYTLDPRGLTAFDEDLSSKRALKVIDDQARLDERRETLYNMASATDGMALVNTNNLDAALNRMLVDVGSYYLLGYYSTNTKLDGRFRKLTVRVKRPGVDVRARPGYLAPTEAEAAAARVDRLVNGAKPGFSDTPPEMRRALERIVPSRGVVPVRVSAAGAPGRISMTTEIDASVFKSGDWEQGGTARVSIEHSRGDMAPIQREIALAPGQRAFNHEEGGAEALPPGRYIVRLSLTPKGGTLPLQTSVDVVVPNPGALLANNGIASRRGPSTGLQYVTTADTRYQRTERIRFEVPRLSTEGTVTGRLLSRNGQPLPITVNVSERVDAASKVRYAVADVTLAPLAQGEYMIEVVVEKDGKTERAIYGFRLVP
jgi:VWFA-related protein